MEAFDLLLAFGAGAGAIAAIWKIILPAYKHLKKPAENSENIEDIRAKHEEDAEATNSELYELTLGVQAALDGLMQLGCNGNVTKAHARLQKHITKKAHHQE